MPQMPEGFKSKSFWERPEGTTGMIIGIPLILGGGYGLYHLLPYMIDLMENMIYLTCMGVGLTAALFIGFDKRFQTLIWNMYKSAMRGLTGIFVTIDPIGILKNYVDALKANAGDMDKQIGKLRGQMRILKDTINQNEKQRVSNLQLASQAKQQDKQSMVILKSRKAGRLEESNMTLQNLYQRMEMLYRVLGKMYETCLILIEDMSDEVEVKSKERQMILSSYSAYKSAAKIVNGEPDKKEMFDQAMEYLAQDYGNKLGEIEHFMDVSKSFIDSVDLQNGVYEESAMKQLEAWEKQTDSLLLGDQKRVLISQSKDPAQVIDLNMAHNTIETPSKREVIDYDKLINQ